MSSQIGTTVRLASEALGATRNIHGASLSDAFGIRTRYLDVAARLGDVVKFLESLPRGSVKIVVLGKTWEGAEYDGSFHRWVEEIMLREVPHYFEDPSAFRQMWEVEVCAEEHAVAYADELQRAAEAAEATTVNSPNTLDLL